jgi:NADH-quinone oxidoreductase subunit L
MPDLIWLVPGFPALGFLVLVFGGRRMPRRAVGIVASAAAGLGMLYALGALAFLLRQPAEGRSVSIVLAPWIRAGNLDAHWGFLLDPLSAVMILVVTVVGFLIHVYSIGYMGEDPDQPRFFAYLNLFMTSMLMLVLADNYLVMFLGWEGVGLCSYLLIGFWYQRDSAATAGKKAFIVNRVGDAGFLLALFLIFQVFGSLNFKDVFAQAGGRLAPGGTVAVLIALGLFVGATGKSAQLPLYVWLPDAMEGPTPVSALIHAATMVTAGVYMVARSGALYAQAPGVLTLVAWVGALTAVFAATIACVQTDIKRVVAYSTISQLGYMFLGCGVGAYASAIFHLGTHAFFKALLFLGCGSVIHALGGEQDMRKMGRLHGKLPITSWTFWLASLANAGIIPLAGFWSKDEILAGAFAGHHYILWLLGSAGALLTAFYMFRLYYTIFEGRDHVDPHAAHHVHESPPSMAGPLLVLGAGTVGVGLIFGVPPDAGLYHHFVEPVFKAAGVEAHAIGREATVGLMVVATVIAVAGIWLARAWYRTGDSPAPAQAMERHPGVYAALANKYWVDEAYDAFVVEPIRRGSVQLWHAFDERIVDGLVNGVGAWVQARALELRRVQTGVVPTYVLSFLVGVVAILGYFMLAH